MLRFTAHSMTRVLLAQNLPVGARELFVTVEIPVGLLCRLVAYIPCEIHVVIGVRKRHFKAGLVEIPPCIDLQIARLVQSPKHELDAAQERIQFSRRLAYVELQKFIVQLVLHFLHAFHYGEIAIRQSHVSWPDQANTQPCQCP